MFSFLRFEALKGMLLVTGIPDEVHAILRVTGTMAIPKTQPVDFGAFVNPGAEYAAAGTKDRYSSPMPLDQKAHLLLEIATEKRSKMLQKCDPCADADAAIKSIDDYTPFVIRMIELERKCANRSSIFMNSLFFDKITFYWTSAIEDSSRAQWRSHDLNSELLSVYMLRVSICVKKANDLLKKALDETRGDNAKFCTVVWFSGEVEAAVDALREAAGILEHAFARVLPGSA